MLMKNADRGRFMKARRRARALHSARTPPSGKITTINKCHNATDAELITHASILTALLAHAIDASPALNRPTWAPSERGHSKLTCIRENTKDNRSHSVGYVRRAGHSPKTDTKDSRA